MLVHTARQKYLPHEEGRGSSHFKLLTFASDSIDGLKNSNFLTMSLVKFFAPYAPK